ncbi:hypothetical protein BBP40_011392 [Aspergillus hancockii]|nr:hypothetical protein BBP40_011392 [Aspergillus hancockii]
MAIEGDNEVGHNSPNYEGRLPRRFGAFSIIALAFVMTNSWCAYTPTFVAALSAGGSSAVFWAPVVAALACGVIATGMAELASAFPASGGPYHYTYMLSPEKYRFFLAYLVGWLSMLAWLFAACSVCVYTARSLLAIGSLYNVAYTATQWQVWTVYTGIVASSASIMCLLPRVMPLMNSILFWMSVLGLLASTTALLAASGATRPGSAVFTEWVNQTGWNDGIAFLLAVGQCMFSFMCLDAASQFSEQIQNPSRDVPRAMLGAVLIGLVTIALYSIAILFSVNDFAPIIASDLPILEVYRQALDSRGGAVFFAVVVVIICFGGSMAGVAGASYLIWAFARGNGVPFSHFFAKIHPQLQAPVNSTVLTAVFCIVYGLLYIASTTAFNSFVSTSVLTLYITYAVPQGIVLWRGRDAVLPEHSFDLGRIFGPFCNIFSCLWMSLYMVVLCLPIYIPVAAETMNYVFVVVIGSLVFIAVMWIFQGRTSFTGPQNGYPGSEMGTVQGVAISANSKISTQLPP